jgi:hypothetical protein
MRYKDLCAQMDKAGWMSHTIAACNTDHREGSGAKHFTAKRLLGTRTGQAFLASQHIPAFNAASATRATIRYHDEHGWQHESVMIDPSSGYILLVQPTTGRRFFAYLSDIPGDRITYDGAPPPVDSSHLNTFPSDIEPDEISAMEGSASTRQHLRRERDPAIVAAKRRQVLSTTGNLACSVCDFDFHRFYGQRGAYFCEVHHLLRLSDTEGPVETKLDDLAVVCSNCHRMIHRKRPFLTLEQLKSHLQNGEQ